MAEKTEPAFPALIVGLGNPGAKYTGTRHNVGFEVVDRISRRWQIPLKEERRFCGEYAAGSTPQHKKIYLLKPLTYMNRSGQAIRAATDWLKLAPSQVLLIYDDMDLPVGRLRLRLSGSAGGHNGVKSAIAHLGTQNFCRLRIGIGSGSKSDEQAVVAHVLGRFSPKERLILDRLLPTAVDALEAILVDGMEKTMSLYNSVDHSSC